MTIRNGFVVDTSVAMKWLVDEEDSETALALRDQDLALIEVSTSGLGLHWPRLDADLYVPALLQSVLGSPGWTAARLGAEGGRATSPAKAAAARSNGRKGGRPRRQVG